jgi:dTMP kinase
VCTLAWSPAKEASVPNIVPSERLTSANSLSLAAAYGTFPVAAILFALLAQVAKWLGGIDALSFFQTDQTALAFYVDMATFLASAFLISTLALPDAARRAKKKANGGSGKRVNLTQTFHELKEGWQFIFLNPVVRSVNLGLATGLIGGGMLVPLGSIFARDILGAGAAGYGIFITALGFGVAAGVLLLSVTQKKLPLVRMFELSIFGAGGALIVSASLSSLSLAVVGVFVLGVCGGSVYVVGFTLLHENVEDELRGRIFSALYTIVRLCLLIAFALGPFLSELLDRASKRLFTNRTITILGRDLFVPGERLTLWLAGAIILGAGTIVVWSLRAGTRESQTV